MHGYGDVFFCLMPLAQTWHAIAVVNAMDSTARNKLRKCYALSRQGRPYYALTFVRKTG
jgi:hypothetical protein